MLAMRFTGFAGVASLTGQLSSCAHKIELVGKLKARRNAMTLVTEIMEVSASELNNCDDAIVACPLRRCRHLP